MELTFYMSGEDYYLAYVKRAQRTKAEGYSTKSRIMILVLISIGAVLISLLMRDPYYAVMVLIMALILFPSTEKSKKKKVLKQFGSSVIPKSPHTIRLYDEGLEVINGYEKIFVTWQRIFYIGESATHIIILPTHSKGIFAINKSKFASPELDALIAQIREKTSVEEVKR